jgi:large subunit ribosomal protein L2
VVRHKSRGFYKNYYLLHRNFLLWNTPGMIIALELNSTTNTYVSLIAYPFGILNYVPAVSGHLVGGTILNSWRAPIKLGNSLPLENIPLNIKINSLEGRPGSGAIYVRAPGNWALIVAKKQNLAKILFKNGRVKFLHTDCFATIGRVSNPRWRFKKLFKAGDSRNLGKRPAVRGVAKNAVDHPHGGGKGKKSKNAVPEAPWGVRKYKKKLDKRLF